MTSATTIPIDWSVHTLDEVSAKIQDGTHFSPRLGGSDYRYITSRNIGNGCLRLDAVEMISESEHRKIYRRCDTRLGDLLLTKDGANTGNAAMNSFVDEISLLSSVAFIRANHRRAVESYILQYLLSGPGRKQIDDAMAGNAITRLTLAKIKALQVPMPPVEEQRQIAAALADADDLIATLERLIAKKQAIKQGMLQQLLTGRTRLPGFEAEWTDVVLGDVARFSKGAGLPKSALTSSGSASCIHYGELFTFYGPEIRKVASRTNPIGRMVVSEDLDVLMPTSDVTPRGLAKASAIHGRGVVLGGDILVIRPEIGRTYGPFLAHIIRHDADQVLQLVRGSTVYHLYASDMRNFTLSLPSVEEQKAIAEALLDVEQAIEALRVRLAKARDIKTGMMQPLLTGRTRLPLEAAS